jgi:tRNA threonylcarbamoyladenosine biosynthesis protein TsaE
LHSPDHNESTAQLHLPTPESTDGLGAQLAKCLVPGLVIWLEGDLGAGKTALVRAVLRALGHTGPVNSPTYTLLELYKVSSLYCYHFDFYRFNEPREFQDAGLDEYFDGSSVCFVEWPDKAAGYVPAADLRIGLVHAASGRDAILRAIGERGSACLASLRTALAESLPAEPPLTSGGAG